MPDLIPVDSDPFTDAPSLFVPIPHDPFATPKPGMTVPPADVGQAAARLPGQIAQGAWNASGLGDVYDTIRRGGTWTDVAGAAVPLAMGMMAGPEERGVAAAEEAAAPALKGIIGYHGSPLTDLRTIQAAPAARQFDNATSQFGAFFAPNADAAQRYAGATGRVYKTDLSLSNPYEMPWSEFHYFQSPQKGPEGESLPGEQWAQRSDALKQEAASYRDQLMAAGHDGLVVRNSKGQPVEIASFHDVNLPPSILAYHGSPYDFDKFDLSKIGTGEGAQAYGHGLYFAENEGTAKSYRDALSLQNHDPPLWELQNRQLAWSRLRGQLKKDGLSPDDIDSSIYALEGAYNQGKKSSDMLANIDAFPPAGQQAIRRMGTKFDDLYKPPGGKMYQVNIAADPEHFLDWDKPLSQQSAHVQQALGIHNNPRDFAAEASAKPGTPEYDALQREMDTRIGSPGVPDMTGADFYRGDVLRGSAADEAGMSNYLRGKGVAGIKYLDQGSRGSGAGTSNYVVFDDRLISILKKYGLAGLIAGGASHFSTTPVDHNPFQQ